jgi:hypothetical protein
MMGPRFGSGFGSGNLSPKKTRFSTSHYGSHNRRIHPTSPLGTLRAGDLGDSPRYSLPGWAVVVVVRSPYASRRVHGPPQLDDTCQLLATRPGRTATYPTTYAPSPTRTPPLPPPLAPNIHYLTPRQPPTHPADDNPTVPQYKELP